MSWRQSAQCIRSFNLFVQLFGSFNRSFYVPSLGEGVACALSMMACICALNIRPLIRFHFQSQSNRHCVIHKQTVTFLSLELVAKWFLSGDAATESTHEEWPAREEINWFDFVSYTFICMSSDAVMRAEPSAV